MKKYPLLTTLFAALLLLQAACSKDWLDAKRNLNTVVPVSLDDLEAVLSTALLPSMAHDQIGMMLMSCDDYISADANIANAKDQNLYTWQSNIYDGSNQSVLEWDNSYQQVLSANVALEGIAKIEQTTANARQWERVKGEALFFRSKAFYNLLQQFAPSYQSETAGNDAGIPLRLSSDPNVKSSRQSVAAGYEQVIADLREAASRLGQSPEQKVLPGKQAAFALLARCLLSMCDYDKATRYADSALQNASALIDYSTVNRDASFPFPFSNQEVVFHSHLEPVYLPTLYGFSQVNPELQQLYQEGDLRVNLFFTADKKFKGSYSGGEPRFSGLALDELYLIRAEGYARSGRINEALADINTLLSKRFEVNAYLPHTTENTPDVLAFILLERRKELAFRGLRWSDLRRLNQEKAYAVTLTRILGDQTFSLPPNDPRYTLPIPDYIIRDAGLTQNIR